MSENKQGGSTSLASIVVSIQRGSASTKTIIQKPSFTIGRSMSCDVRLTDVLVSRTHATIEMRAGRIFITDKTSSHGTFINSVKISPMDETEVKPPDLVKIGETMLSFSFGPPVSKAATPAEESQQDGQGKAFQLEQSA